MLLVYIGLYTLALAIIWGFFIVLKIHAYKFKNFSENITKITTLLLIFLISFSLLWYILIIFWYDSKNNFEINITNDTDNYSEIDY